VNEDYVRGRPRQFIKGHNTRIEGYHDDKTFASSKGLAKSSQLEAESQWEDQFCECGCGQITSRSKINDKENGYQKGQPKRFVNRHRKRKMWPDQLCACGCGEITERRIRKDTNDRITQEREPKLLVQGHSKLINAITREAILRDYNDGRLLLREIAAKHSVSVGTVSNYAKKANLPKRDTSLTRNKGFFQSIDTPEKAYWLGFLLADGSIDKTNVCIKLQEQDRDHLAKFTKALDSVVKVQELHQKGRTYYKVALASSEMVDDLARLGIIPNKTFVVNPPIEAIHDSLQHHFWRGVIDGDGWISIWPSAASKANYAVILGLSGNKGVVEAFADFFNKCAATRPSPFPRKNKPNSWQIASGRLESLELMLNLLYNSGGPALERKRDKANEAIRIIQRWKENGGKSDPPNKCRLI
jgi:hypothetical protein